MVSTLKKYYAQYKCIPSHEKTILFSAGSFITNALIGIGKLLIGIIIFSPWFIVTAIYYLFLCVAKSKIIVYFYTKKTLTNQSTKILSEFTIFRYSGLFICLLGISYLIVCYTMYYKNESMEYPFYLAYGVAAVAFYKISMAIYGIIKSRKVKSPLFSAVKTINFVDASVSIVAVQCSLLTMEQSAEFANKTSALFGGGCSIIFIIIGIFMFYRKNNF